MVLDDGDPDALTDKGSATAPKCERVIDLSEGEVQRVRLHDGAENKTIELSHRLKTRLKTLARP